MPQYLALTYTADVDWWAPEQASELAEYRQFGVDHAGIIRGERRAAPDQHGHGRPRGRCPWRNVVTTDGPYAETKEALTGYYLIEAADLDEAVAISAEIPAAWGGAVEVRPVIAAK